jgi:hypothetical protein
MQYGEFESSDSPYFSEKIIQSRVFFLQEIEESKPEILQSLYDEVYTPFRSCFPYDEDRLEKIEECLRLKWYEECLKKTTDQSKIRRLSMPFISKLHKAYYWTIFEAANDKYHPELIPLREAVRQWSKKQNLDADWCRAIALDSMRWFDDAKKLRWFDDAKKLRWQITRSGRAYIEHQVEMSFLPCPNFPAWSPFWQRKSDYLERLKDKVTESVNAFFSTHPLFAGLPEKIKQRTMKDIYREGEIYCSKLFDYYQRKGYTQIKLSRDEERKIRWTVLAQVGTNPLMFSQIARKYRIATNHVSENVKDCLKEIDLPARDNLFGSGRRIGIKEKKRRNIANR